MRLLSLLLLSAISFLHAHPCKRCGDVPYPTNDEYVTPAPIIDSPLVWSFVSEPNLHPMKIQVNKHEAGTSPGYVALAPYGFSDEAMYGQSGSLLVDNDGNPVWFRPLSSPNLMNTDFRKQYYKKKPVLTFWQGTLVTPPAYTNAPGGSSEPGSCFYILDSHYKVLHTIRAHRGYVSDIHEFLLTPQNTALILSTKQVPMDLTPYGGPADGVVQDFAIQEIDVETNELLFFWNALDHIPLSDSYESASSSDVWDAYHLNSIGITDNPDDILLSSRSMWAIYRINKPTGNILWQLGGMQSDFSFGPNAAFSWQHDARYLSNTLISLFDDNSDGSTSTPPSHGLMLQLDFTLMTANVYRTYYHDPNISVASQGNLQSLKNGNKFIGWGQSQYYSEFASDGNSEANPSLNLLYDAQMPSTNYSYRAYREEWVGKPCYPPSIAVQDNIVYASWNGSTEAAKWQVYAGKKPKKLHLVACKAREGFETAIEVDAPGPYYRVEALDKRGKTLGKSKIVKYIGS